MKNTENKFDATSIEKKIGYHFKNRFLLEQAFTRSSYSREDLNSEDNEVLEFIGDSIVGPIVVKQLVTHYQIGSSIEEQIQSLIPTVRRDFKCELDEAELSTLKIELVQRSSLARSTERFGLEEYLRLGKGDIVGNVKEQASVKEDLLEAIVGAVAIDSGWDMCILEELVKRLIDIEDLLENGGSHEEDYEKILNDWFAQKGKSLIFKEAAPICKNLKYAFCVDLGIDMLNYSAYGYGITENGARRMAAKRAVRFIEQTSDRASAIINAVGYPDLNRAVNQLQELYQKKLIPEPVYVFSKLGASSTGNPEWECVCTIEGIVEDSGGYICSSKNEAKKQIAFEVLNYLIGKDLKSLFIEHGTVES